MGKEGPALQHDMFTGELVDTRTARQKRQDREWAQGKQLFLFSQQDIAQFGVNPHPLLPIPAQAKAGPLFEDRRTEEEIEQDRQRAAEEKTYQMFVEQPSPDTSIQPDEMGGIVPDTTTLALVVVETPCLALTIIPPVRRDVLVVAQQAGVIVQPI
jgi:hypothetical protein